MFVFGSRSMANLARVHPDLQRCADRAIQVTAVDFGVIEGIRTPARQRELMQAGASQTMNSRHLSGHAIDVMAYVGTEGRWDSGLYYEIARAFQVAAKELVIPLRWGGSWMRLDLSQMSPWDQVAAYAQLQRQQGKRPFVDLGHFELPSAAYPA